MTTPKARKKGLDRRTLLSAGALATMAACGPGPERSAADPAAPAVVTRKTRKLSMVTTWPKNFPGLGTMAVRVAEMMEGLSDGAMTVKVYADNELVPAFQAFDAVATGGADMYHGAEYYWQGKSKAFNFFTSVPMGLTQVEMMGWLDYGGGQQLWEELAAPFNIIAFAAGNSGHQMGGWFKREVNSLEDFRGLKMRIPGLGGEVVRALGGVGETIAGSEIFQALQSGRIDATEWVGPWNDLAFGFHRAASFYYGPGFHEPGSMLSCGVNRKLWESFSEDEKRITRAACAYATAASLGEFDHFNAVALEALEKEHGVKLRAFPDDVWAKAGEAAAAVLADIAKSDPITGKVYESFQAARKRALAWSGVAEGPYLQRRAARRP